MKFAAEIKRKRTSEEEICVEKNPKVPFRELKGTLLDPTPCVVRVTSEFSELKYMNQTAQSDWNPRFTSDVNKKSTSINA